MSGRAGIDFGGGGVGEDEDFDASDCEFDSARGAAESYSRGDVYE